MQREPLSLGILTLILSAFSADSMVTSPPHGDR